MEYPDLTLLEQHEKIIAIAFVASFMILLYNFLRFTLPFLCKKNKCSELKSQAISIVLPIWWNDGAFFQNAEMLLKQDVSDYELVIVDATSDLDVEQKLAILKQKYPQLSLTFIPRESITVRQTAITIGVKAARNPWILYLDSECRINSTSWLNEFSEVANESVDFLIGQRSIIRGMGLIGYLNRLEHFSRNRFSAKFSCANYPLIFDARNVAFRKEVFMRSKPFQDNLKNGFTDHEIWLSKQMRRAKKCILRSSDSMIEVENRSVFMQKLCNWKNNQKILHRSYGMGIVLFYVEISTNILFYILGFYLLLSSAVRYHMLGIIVFYFLLQLIGFKLITKRLNQSKILLSSFIYDLLQPLIWIIDILFGLLNSKR